MPSFIIHEACKQELIKRMNIKGDDKQMVIANLLPDAISEVDETLPYEERRRLIQTQKIKTHFRTDINKVYQYPNVKLIKEKYLDLIKTDIVSFFCYFHLYTDYIYFTRYLPKCAMPINGNMKETLTRGNIKYIRINKSNELVPISDFWGKEGKNAIYVEYIRVTKQLLKDYPFNYTVEELREYIKDHPVTTEMEEIVSSNPEFVFDILEGILNDAKELKDNDLYIFNYEDMISYIKETVTSFIEENEEIVNCYVK